MNISNIPKFVINLKRRSDRLEKFQKSISLQDVIIVCGFDGKNPGSECENEQQLFNMLPNNLMVGEKGVFISHLRIYQKIVDENIPYAIIFEDDAILCEDFEKKLEETVQNIPIDTDILFFGGRFDADFKMEEGTYLPISENIVAHTSIRWEQRNQVNHDRTYIGYIISNKLANSLIQYFNKRIDIYLPIDHWVIKYCMNNGIQILNTYPLLCHSPAASPDSDIRWSSYYNMYS